MARGTRALPGGGSGLGPLVEIRAKGPAGLVGTVSHRPFLGCPVPESFVPCGLPGEVGMARGTRALPGGGSGLGPLMEIRANEARGSGRDGVSPSGSWAVRSLNRSFPGLSGEVGMARGTRALPGGGSGLGPLVEIRARGAVGSPARLASAGSCCGPLGVGWSLGWHLGVGRGWWLRGFLAGRPF